jgi:hypothetical protein
MQDNLGERCFVLIVGSHSGGEDKLECDATLAALRLSASVLNRPRLFREGDHGQKECKSTGKKHRFKETIFKIQE